MDRQNFYRAFEDRHRGSRDLIKSRLAVYLPFILPLKQFDGVCQGIDLGCGRGEWLELMRENEVDVRGVDLDLGMLESAQERGLNVSRGDAIVELESLPDSSLSIVSGFHLAEHLPFDVLQLLIQESFRVLKPGGLLILETPNPENIVVGTADFYLDPTHQRPIPSQLLSFMVEYAGFGRVKVLRLQEPANLVTNNSLSLLDVLGGVSPDYAVVAQKGGAPETALALTPMFEAEYGLSLELLANKYHEQAEAKAEQAEAKAEQAEAKAYQFETALTQVYASTSWRVTVPLRKAGRARNALLQLNSTIKSGLKSKIKLLLTHARLYVTRRPKLKYSLLRVFDKFPYLKIRLIALTGNNTSEPALLVKRVPLELANLTPNAREIYHDLKLAFENKNKEAQ